MALPTSITRLGDYYSRHGLRASLRRASLQVKRAALSGRMVVFYCDLQKQNVRERFPESVKIERIMCRAQLGESDLQDLIGFWNPKQALRNIQERFEKGATLWLVRWNDQLAGFSWSIIGQSIAPYYFPIGIDDVQLFDFFAFPKFRGRPALWCLITHILNSLAAEGQARVFGDVAEWNQASLSFYKLLPFHPLGSVQKVTVFGHTFTRWTATSAELMRPRFATQHPRVLDRLGSER